MAKKTTFPLAFTYMRDGEKVKRKMWKAGNATYVSLNAESDGFLMKMKGGASIPWVPSNADIFADDWEMI